MDIKAGNENKGILPKYDKAAPVIDIPKNIITTPDLPPKLYDALKGNSDLANYVLHELTNSEKRGEVIARMQQRDETYLLKAGDALRARYENPDSKKDRYMAEVGIFAMSRGVDMSKTPESVGDGAYSGESIGTGESSVEKAALKLVEQFFKSETGSNSAEKYKMVAEQTLQYIQLIAQAQVEGSIPADLTISQVYKLVAENIAVMAYQDNAAAEVMLGDHGVRHLVGHNIDASMEMADALAGAGRLVTAKDRLIMHQIMMYHDSGYSMGPVRSAILTDGIKGQDSGHNVLGSQLVREHFVDQTDVWNKLFSADDMEIIQKGILYHDKDENGGGSVDFSARKEGEEEVQARTRIIESVIRTADNTHAFETKLPELLYSFPDTLKYLRLLKTAGEVGDKSAVESVKQQLIAQIQKSPELSSGDKKTLEKAAQGLDANSYNFSVGRICGNNPEFSMDGNGSMSIIVQESQIHQEVMGLFGKEAYDQLVKFIADLKGVKKQDVDLNTDEIQAGSLNIRVRKGEQKAQEITDYQQKIKDLISNDPGLVEWSQQDTPLSLEQRALEALDKALQKAQADHDDQKAADLTVMIRNRVGSGSIQDRISQIKDTRKKLFADYGYTT